MNIEKMSLDELTKLHTRVTAAMPVARERELTAARKELTDLALAKGFSIPELIGKPAQRNRRKPVTVTKLRDEKSGVIWAGRGRLPKGFDRANSVPV